MKKSMSLPEPCFEFLFSAVLCPGKIFPVGRTPAGVMNIVPFSEGTFEGPKLSGSIVPCGGDWNTLRPDDVSTTDGKYMLKTQDGKMLSVETKGSAFLTETQAAALRAGEGLPAGYKSQQRLFFKTGERKYKWLNDVIALAEALADETGKVHIKAFVVR